MKVFAGRLKRVLEILTQRWYESCLRDITRRACTHILTFGVNSLKYLVHSFSQTLNLSFVEDTNSVLQLVAELLKKYQSKVTVISGKQRLNGCGEFVTEINNRMGECRILYWSTVQ